MKHYVILHDYAAEDIHGITSGDIVVAGVAHTPKEAGEKLASASNDERQYAKERGWEIFEDSSTEFDAGEEGNYTAEHSHYYIKEVDDSCEVTNTTDILNKINELEEATLNHYRGNITRSRYESDIDNIRRVVIRETQGIEKPEPSDTDLALVKKLFDVFEAESTSVVYTREKNLIANTLEINLRNVRELNNLRDTVMMVGDISQKSIYTLSAIASVIDDAIVRLGGEL